MHEIFTLQGYQKKKKREKRGVVVLESDKIDFKTKKVTRDKEGKYIMIKGSVQQENITFIYIYTYIYIYTPNPGAPAYVKQILTELKELIECNAFILGGFNTPLTPEARSTKQKISKDTEVLNSKKLKAFPLRSGTKRMPTPPTVIQYSTEGPSNSN